MLLAKALGVKHWSQTDYGKTLIKAAGFQDNDSTTPVVGDHTIDDIDWETEFSTTIWDEIRRDLVIEPLYREVQMPTNNVRLPVNPDQDYATYIATDEFKGSSSTESANSGNRLTEATLIAHKLSAVDAIGDEEEEDSILPLIPIIRANIARRMAKSADRSLLRGVGATHADPIKGLVQFATDDSNTGADNGVELSVGSGDKLTLDNLLSARRNLGVFGINPRDVMYIVSDTGYYDLLQDPDFQTMEKVGDRATYITGQVAEMAGSPVLVSGEFSVTPSSGETTAVVVNMRPMVKGVHRPLRVMSENDRLQEKRTLVATRRFGSTRLETGTVTTVDYKA